MIAAIYARKSTDQSAIADESKSVTRQVENAKAFAAARGWHVDERFIYVDDGVSGAEFSRRPGFVRLMNALKPRASFQVLIISELSRVGREQLETGYALKQLSQAGVRIYSYLDDREIALENAIDVFTLQAATFAATIEREKGMQRARDKSEQLARAGYVTGGRVFGYDNVEVLGANGKRSHVERSINEDEAAVVRRMFELAAAGAGQARIAKQLNAEGACAPRPQRDRPAGWAASSVHEVLFRELYRGVIVWNRTRKRNRWGEVRTSDRPASEWMRIDAPQLRIVDEDLWQAAHARIAEARRDYHVATKGLRGGRPRIESHYLLPGLARCAMCGSGMMVRTGSSGTGSRRRRLFSYACSAHHNPGTTVCANSVHVPMDAIDRAVLEQIGEVFTADMVDEVITRARELLEAPHLADPREPIALALAEAEAMVERYAEAIGLAGNIAAAARRLQEAEQRRQALVQELAAIGGGVRHPPKVDWRLVERVARQRLENWRALLGRHTSEARQVLQAVLVAPLQLTPFREFGKRGYRFEGHTSTAGLFVGSVDVNVCRGNWRPHRVPNWFGTPNSQ